MGQTPGQESTGTGPAALPASTTPSESGLREEVRALHDEVAALRAQVAETRAPAPSAATEAPPLARPLGYETFWPWALPPEGISGGGYLQGEYQSRQDSQDQLFQGGAPMNQDRFLVRRARASVTGEWRYAAVAVELDANTTSGPQVDLRKAEASLQYRPDRSLPPIVMVTLGQFDTPFGYELVESPRTRWFMERSLLSRAFWPGEPDLGLRVAGALGFFRWKIAALNGEPLGEKSPYALQDPNAAKDVVFRFGLDQTFEHDTQVAGGVSAIRGKGFHPGTDATKSTIQWHDLNETGVVQPYDLTGVPGAAATPSSNFDRWAVGADVRFHHRWWLGVAKIYGEFVVAANMDRGLFVADPGLTQLDQRELGFYVGGVQEIGRYGVVGFRYDYYDPNADVFDKRGGKLLPYSQAIRTYSPLLGFVLPDRARLLFQYDLTRNALARDVTGVPTNLKSNAWTVRLQVQL
jgi:phosphate-selective porin